MLNQFCISLVASEGRPMQGKMWSCWAAGTTGVTDYVPQRERCEEIRSCKTVSRSPNARTDFIFIIDLKWKNLLLKTFYLSNFKIKNDTQILAYMDT